jgi:hypothetical protein
MSFDNINMRGKLQLSRLLHGVEIDIENILRNKSENELELLEKEAVRLYSVGLKKYMQIVDEVDNESEDAGIPLSSPHAILHGDAIELGIAKEGNTPPRRQAELIAALANIVLHTVPFDLRWGVSESEDLPITDPFELVRATVSATSAMDLIHRALKIFEVSDEASKRAGKAHKENRAMKEQARAWWRDNNHLYNSKDGAAEVIAGKVVPVKFRTARRWLDDWPEKPSAGRG